MILDPLSRISGQSPQVVASPAKNFSRIDPGVPVHKKGTIS
jgi:hypothetical protein